MGDTASETTQRWVHRIRLNMVLVPGGTLRIGQADITLKKRQPADCGRRRAPRIIAAAIAAARTR
jgi:hypothetical protein